MHVLVGEAFLQAVESGSGPRQVPYRRVDDGDLAVIDDRGDGHAVAVTSDGAAAPAPDAAGPDLLLRISPAGDGMPAVAAYRRSNDDWSPIGSTVLAREPDVFDRVRGVFESDLLREKCVLVLGVGSGGSFVVRELVRAGVGRFLLIDHDRLDESNVSRHELGLSDVGRLKVNAMRDYIHDRNPSAIVDCHSFRLDGTTQQEFLDLCGAADPDVLICGTDNRESRLLMNRAGLMCDLVALYGGVRRRAYAGQVLRVIPHLTPCYQCFVQGLPDVVTDVEISSESDAERIAYTDRPVEPEPGLASDIAPVALFIAKLALVELMTGHESPAFDSLREDLVAPWFFWLNRREPGTEFEHWPPLGDGQTGVAALRWLGQYLERNEECPACGTPQRAANEDEVAAFRGRSA